MIAHQHLQQHPPKSVPNKTAPGRQSSTRAITSTPQTASQNSTKLHAPCTLPSISQNMRLHRHPKSTPNSTPPNQTASQNATCTSTPSCMPVTLPSRCKNVPAPSPACPIAPGRQYCKLRLHRHQHLKQLPKQHPKTPPAPAPPNCMPPSTPPLILKRCARTAISTSNSTPIRKTSTPNCTPLSTSPILQITSPSLLEVRTPIAFSYLGNNLQKCHRSCFCTKRSFGIPAPPSNWFRYDLASVFRCLLR